MNFEDEEYVRVYCRDTPTTDRIGWEGRTVLWHLERVIPKSGVLEFDETDDLVEVVASLCKLPEELTKLGLERLASRGVTRRHAASIEIVKFVEAQNAKRSDRLRAQDYRDRQKTKEEIKPDENAVPSRRVTARHDSSLLASPPLPLPPPALPCPAEEARAGAEPAAAAAADLDFELTVSFAAEAKRPGDLKSALALPIQERAVLLLENPTNATWVQPQKWPEVVAVAECLAKSARQGRPRLSDYGRDAGVRGVIGLFADGYSVDELKRVCVSATRSEWWRKGGPKGLSSLTPEVVRRELAGRAEEPLDFNSRQSLESSQRVRGLLAEVDAARASGVAPPVVELTEAQREAARQRRRREAAEQAELAANAVKAAGGAT